MSFISFVPPLIAHRGANVVAPENTLAAFLQAKELGAQWIEFDVMLAACGEAVVIHDETLERTTDGTGNVADYPYSYLKTLDAGSWFGLEFANERIPTFKAVIEFLREHQLAANVEIKAVPGQEEAVVKKVLNDIRECWTPAMPAPLLSSFSLPILHQVRQAAPDAMIGVLIHEWFTGWEAECQALLCTSVNLNEAIITPEKIAAIKAMDKLILSYTVNTIERARELFAMSIDAVFTDEFERLNEYFSDVQM